MAVKSASYGGKKAIFLPVMADVATSYGGTLINEVFFASIHLKLLSPKSAFPRRLLPVMAVESTSYDGIYSCFLPVMAVD